MAIEKLSNQVGNIARCAALAHAPKYMQQIIRTSIELGIEREKEKQEADSIGMTIRQYQIYKQIPAGLCNDSIGDFLALSEYFAK